MKRVMWPVWVDWPHVVRWLNRVCVPLGLASYQQIRFPLLLLLFLLQRLHFNLHADQLSAHFHRWPHLHYSYFMTITMKVMTAKMTIAILDTSLLVVETTTIMLIEVHNRKATNHVMSIQLYNLLIVTPITIIMVCNMHYRSSSNSNNNHHHPC